MPKQKTIKKAFSLEGKGLHTGSLVRLTFLPAIEDSGIRFIRVDLPDKPVIPVNPSMIYGDHVSRCTCLGTKQVMVQTVEHLLSVLHGLGITNLTLELNGQEIPGMDGSGLDFLKAIKKVGIQEQSVEVEPFYLREPVMVESNGSTIFAVPAQDLKISYTLSYDHPVLKSQFFSVSIDAKTFERELAPCRTFCLERETYGLKAKGLGKGATYSNTLVVGQKGVIRNKLKFPDEFARHKVLDLLGDLYLVGFPVRAHFFAIRSGHHLNIQLVKKIFEQKKRTSGKSSAAFLDIKGKEISIEQIMDILPHRYPFLLVDRVIELDKGKKAIGIKNVTINDNFFRGHFPTRPVMPGVLMVEAMAQTAGVVVLTHEANRDKVAFFLAANDVKFRKVVIPGDQLVMEVEVIKLKAKFAQIRGVARVGQDVVAEAEMIFSFTDRVYLDE